MPSFCVISPNSVAFGAHYAKVVKDRPIGPTVCDKNVEMYSPKNLGFLEIYHLWQYLGKFNTENECILISEVIYCGSQLMHDIAIMTMQ